MFRGGTNIAPPHPISSQLNFPNFIPYNLYNFIDNGKEFGIFSREGMLVYPTS